MGMADDKTLRSSYRANDPYGRDPVPASERDRGHASDPLAELARLIGQSDPYNDLGRSNLRGSDQSAAASQLVADWRGSPPPYAVRAQEAPLAPASHHPAPAHDDVNEHGYADAGHDAAHHAAGQEEHVPYYSDGTSTAPEDEGAYDDPPQAGRGRRGTLMAVTLIGCAMLGTAGAYGYRTYYAGPATTTANAPVIVADQTPTKVIASTDVQSSKVIQDRVGDQAQAERVVPREEQPVELKPPPASLPPRVVTTVPTIPAALPPAARPSAFPPPAAPASTASSEPKRIRTVTIRPDGSDPSGRPVGTTASTPAPKAAAAPKAARGTPLSLDPQQLTDAPAAPAPRSAPAPAQRVASAPATEGAGGYVVQVSSQRTEAEAQASYRAMQAKYPTAFSGRSPIIKRADLGSKGVFYRALVGPFASSADAGQFCSSLKAAGGQCIIQKN
jgi:hypothetical protein